MSLILENTSWDHALARRDAFRILTESVDCEVMYHHDDENRNVTKMCLLDRHARAESDFDTEVAVSEKAARAGIAPAFVDAFKATDMNGRRVGVMVTRMLSGAPLRKLFGALSTQARNKRRGRVPASCGTEACLRDAEKFTQEDASKLSQTVQRLVESTGYMHMDLNLDNVFISRDSNGEATFKLIDFGRVVDAQTVRGGFDLMDFGWSSVRDRVQGFANAFEVSAFDIIEELHVLSTPELGSLGGHSAFAPDAHASIMNALMEPMHQLDGG